MLALRKWIGFPGEKTDSQNGPAVGIRSQLLLPIASMLTITAFLAAGLIFYFANLQNRQAGDDARRLMAAILRSQQSRMEETTLDYSVWDDFHANTIVSFNREWLASNGWTYKPYASGFMGILDEKGTLLGAFSDGSIPPDIFWKRIKNDALALAGRISNGEEPAAVSLFLRHGGHDYILAAAPLVPAAYENETRWGRLIFAGEITQEMISKLGKLYGMDGLKIASRPPADPRKTFIPISTSDDGNRYLECFPQRPGDQLTYALLPVILLAIGLFFFLTRRMIFVWDRILHEESRQRILAQESRNRFMQISDLNREIIWEIDPDGLYTYMSHACETLLGYRGDEIIGKMHFYDLHPEETREEFRRMTFETIDRKGIFHDLHNIMVARDGRRLDILTNGAPFFDASGNYRGYRGSDHDITEINRATEQARAASSAKSDFLAHMSHELRTPLNAIIGFSDMIAQKTFGENSPKYTEYAVDIKASGMHLLSLINDILDLSKIEAGKYVLGRENIDLSDIINDCFTLTRVGADSKRIAYTIAISGRLPRVSADPRAIKQVLINLMSNAIKFTPGGGSIILSAAHDPVLRQITVSIRDTGIGISPDVQERVFEPFNRGNSMISRSFSGTGLGLPISRNLVEMHGGRLTLESAPNRGTTVSFTIPA